MEFVTKFHPEKYMCPFFGGTHNRNKLVADLSNEKLQFSLQLCFKWKISKSLCNYKLQLPCPMQYSAIYNKTCSMNFFQVNSVRRRVNNDLSALAFFYFVPFVHFLDGSANNQKAIWSVGTRCNGISKRNKSIVHLLIRALLIKHCSSVLNCIQISEREC